MELSQWEGTILLWMQEHLRSAPLDAAVSCYTCLGNGGAIWLVVCVWLMSSPKTRRAGLAGICALMINAILTNILLKPLVHRPRPWLELQELVPLIEENDPNSFPSGHTSSSFAAATVWMRTLPEKKKWLKVLTLILACAMALSRLYVGVHFVSDVLGGVLMGCLCGWLGWKAEGFAEKKWRRANPPR